MCGPKAIEPFDGRSMLDPGSESVGVWRGELCVSEFGVWGSECEHVRV